MGLSYVGVIGGGGFIGFTLGAGLRLAGIETYNYCSLLGFAAGTVFFALKLRRITEWLDLLWKRRVLRQCGLAHLPVNRFRFAVLVTGDSPSGSQVGLLAISNHALVFFKRPAGSVIIRFSEIEGLYRCGWGGATWAGLKLKQGEIYYVQIKEKGEMAWGKYLATGTFAVRLRAKLKRLGMDILPIEENS